MAVERAELYEECWGEPMTKVAARYGVSSSYLARVCERLNVPRPPRGYWAKLEVGKAPPQTRLPEARPGDELAWSQERGLPRVQRQRPQAPQTPAQQRTRSRAGVKQLTQHPLLVGVHKHFEKVRACDRGYLRPTKRLLADIFVSKETLERALEVANKIYCGLERRGYQVAIAPHDQHLQRMSLDERSKSGKDRYEYQLWSPDRPTVVYVGTVAIGLTFFELSEETEVEYIGGNYVPVSEVPVLKRRRFFSGSTWTHTRELPRGKLCLRATSPYSGTSWEKQWRETRKGELGSKLRSIVRELESAAPIIAKLFEEAQQRAAIQRREWELQHQRWLEEEAERRRLKNLKDSQEQLAAIIRAWGEATRVESFFDDAERRANGLSQHDRELMLARVRRARELVGTTDALQALLDWSTPEER